MEHTYTCVYILAHLYMYILYNDMSNPMSTTGWTETKSGVWCLIGSGLCNSPFS